MRIVELISRFEDWKVQGIKGSKNMYKELEELVPMIETKLGFSSLDEGLTIDQSLEGNINKETYYLKAHENGKKYSYIHELKNEDNLDEVRNNAWKQYEAWKELKNKEVLENKN